MSDIISRMKAKISNEPAPTVAQVFETPKQQEEEVSLVVAQPVVEPKIIKQNSPGTPVMGFTLEILADELGVVIEKEMHKSGISSINAQVFGIFYEAGIVPKNFELITDEFIGIDFYVLKTANRMTEIYKTLVKALNSSSSELISFPYLVEHKITLPMRYDTTKNDFKTKELKVASLYLTPKEINNLNYKFITQIQYCPPNPDIEDSIDLIAMKIDREEWKAAPYRVE